MKDLHDSIIQCYYQQHTDASLNWQTQGS